MSTTLTIELPVHFHRGGRGSRKEMRAGTEAPPLPSGRVPRVARLMALALRFGELVHTGQIGSYSELASLGHVTPLFSLRENAIAKEPGASYPERWRCVSRLGAPMVAQTPWSLPRM